MKDSGFIVRFVDVVLILLFGFITISNLQNSEVILPESTEAQPRPMEVDEVAFIGVLPDGTFLIEDETMLISSIGMLRTHLSETVAALPDGALKVRIRSSWDAPVQYALDVAALCDELGLETSIEVEVDVSDA